MSRNTFHRLTVAAVDRLTDDATAVTLAVPPALAARFAFAAGQFLTVRIGDERRSYSICSAVGCPPRFAVREVPGGAVSGHLVRHLRPGDQIEVQPPGGTFTPDLSAGGRHVLLAAGSGITPMLSIAASLLAASPKARVSLLYGNRTAATVMFADEVADLKDAHPGRMQVVHVLSREIQEVQLFSGRLDAGKLRELLPVTVAVTAVDHWWLCGPFNMVRDAMEVLAGLGVADNRVHRELFFVEESAPDQQTHSIEPVADGARVRLVLDGRTSDLVVPAGETVLDGAQRVRPDLPFACKGGVCGTCRARVALGRVAMRRNYALGPQEIDAGYVLTCQSVPLTDEVVVDFDS